MAHEGSGSPGGRRPWWVSGLAGLVCVIVGVGLTFRPFTSLSVLVLAVGLAMLATGVAQFAGPTGTRRTAYDLLAGATWIVGGLVALGLGTASPHPYLIGQGQARSVLDAVRAARLLDDADLSDETVVWGHSQGGHAALWTGMVAPSYAPEVDVRGVAAVAPASDLVALVDHLPDVAVGSMFATYVVHAYAAVYDDVDRDDYVRPAARTSDCEG